MCRPPIIAMLVLSSLVAIVRGEDLAGGFRDPPRSARPWVYWMWLGGNISREGITEDLEAMKRAGIGGALIMNLGVLTSDPVTQDPIAFMTPAWREMVRHALAEAARLGLEIDMNNDDGWNCGGPWIKPDEAMQQLTWSETRVTGPAKFSKALPQPTTLLDTYRDVAVLAVPALGPAGLPRAKKTVQESPTHWVLLAYDQPVTARAITVTGPGPKQSVPRPLRCELDVSDDGDSFRTVRRFETGWMSTFASYTSVTVRLDAARGRFFRLRLPNLKAEKAFVDFRLEPEARVDYWRLKAGFDQSREHGGGSPLFAMPGEFAEPVAGSSIPLDQVIDLSRRMLADGRLDWDVPRGDWIVLRIGHTPTGKQNGFSTAEGRGLDSDKLSRGALEAHLAGMVDKLVADAGPLAGRSLTMMHDDSWESGPQNWTAAFPEQFKQRRGYDLAPWLPVMAGGRVVGSVQQSERFLWDVRRTIADLLVDQHFKHFRELSHARGLKFSSESAGRQQFLYDPISFLAASDLPMGEFWASEQRPRPDCKAAASAAHIANLPVAGAEAFTQGGGGRWLDTPFSLKALGDSAFCFGVNRFVFHRMALQRWPDRKPGLAWPNIGINFDSTQTWWETSGAWMDYLARCQYLLQQGRFVADAAVLTGAGAPNSLIRALEDPVDPEGKNDASTITEAMLRWFGQMPALPPLGYDYDGVDVPTVLQMTVREGILVLPHEMSYRFLVLPPEERMTLALARKIRELVEAGAAIVGPRPKGSPSLTDYPQGDAEIQAIAEEVWGDCDGRRATTHAFGKGRVFCGKNVREVLERLGLRPDFQYTPAAPEAGQPRIDFIHRQTAEAEIYFLCNQRPAPADVRCTFRVSGRQPEIWLPDTGEIFPCQAFQQGQERTIVPLRFDRSGSMFVVFRRPIGTADGGAATSNFPDTIPILTIAGPWTVHFDPRWGGPETARLEDLQSWSRHENAGIRFYSGTATYAKQFALSPAQMEQGREKGTGPIRRDGPKGASHKLDLTPFSWRGNPLYLDLGEVKELARVRLNGKDLGVLWKPPFRVEITAAARPGENRLEVSVTNLWPNRLIGDAALPETDRLTRVNWNPYRADSPLLESGLLGPVTVRVVDHRSTAVPGRGAR